MYYMRIIMMAIGVFFASGIADINQNTQVVVSVAYADGATVVADDAPLEIKQILTIEPALSFTFSGITKEAVVNDMLDRLRNLGIRGTFFITENEAKRQPDLVRRIIAEGHEVGIGFALRANETPAMTKTNLVRTAALLKSNYGLDIRLTKQVSGPVTEATKQVTVDLGYELIGQTINIVQSKHKDFAVADEIVDDIFKKWNTSLKRGQILHYRLDFYTNPHVVCDLLERIKERKVDNIAYATIFDNPATNLRNDSQYVIKPVGEVFYNKTYTYQLPIKTENIPPELRTDAPRVEYTNKTLMREISKRYIGHPDVTPEDRMLGFSKRDARRIDFNGYVQTNENVIFLTFDDWGTDASINKILYVLRKHKVHGNFYIITRNVFENANLLRAIAVEGHEIGSHSEYHMPMAKRDPATQKQVKTFSKEEYLIDYDMSYKKLLYVVGDVVVDGRPVLGRTFRPPTMAVSKEGMEALFDTGFAHIVGGAVSSYDYKAQTVEELMGYITSGIFTPSGQLKKGAIVVLHMSENAVHTAQTLDILLTANEKKKKDDPSKFVLGRISDYIDENYNQVRLARKFAR